MCVNDQARSRSPDFGCLSILVFIGAVCALGLVIASSLWPLAILSGVLAIAAMVATYYFLQIRPHREFGQLRVERAGYTPEDFLRHFQAMGLRRETVEVAWEVLQRWLPWGGFPVLPEDELESRLGIVVHEEIDEILVACLCREPTEDEWERLTDLRTVEDLVILVERLYTGEPQEWSIWNQQPLTWRQRIIATLVFLPIFAILAIALFGYVYWFVKFDNLSAIFVTAAIGLAIAVGVIVVMRAVVSRRGAI